MNGYPEPVAPVRCRSRRRGAGNPVQGASAAHRRRDANQRAAGLGRRRACRARPCRRRGQSGRGRCLDGAVGRQRSLNFSVRDGERPQTARGIRGRRRSGRLDACRTRAPWTTGVLVPAAFRDRQRLLHEFFEPDPMLGFRAKANLRNFEIRWSEAGERAAYSTDAQGFSQRRPQRGRSAHSVPRRLICLGVWLERKLTFPDLLERRLACRSPIGGRQSYGIEQYALLAERFLDAYDPQIVAVCIYANDLTQPISGKQLADFYRAFGWSEFRRYPLLKRTVLHQAWARLAGAYRARNAAPSHLTSRKPRTGCGSTGGWGRTLIMNPQGTTRPSKPGTRTC